jgi:hypothetical protein
MSPRKTDWLYVWICITVAMTLASQSLQLAVTVWGMCR